MVYGETTSHVTAKGWGKTNSCLTFEEKSQMDDGKKAGRGKNPCFPNTRSLSTSAFCLLLKKRGVQITPNQTAYLVTTGLAKEADADNKPSFQLNETTFYLKYKQLRTEQSKL